MIDVQANRDRRHGADSHDELWNEVVAVGVILVGVMLFLALVSNSDGHNLIGKLGGIVSGGLTFVVGRLVAYAVPLVVLGSGILVWRGKGLTRGGLRIIGLYGAVCCVCALLAIPYAGADFGHDGGFRIGGAIGNFLVHGKCLNLAGFLGHAGAYLFFVSLLLVSISLATDMRLRATAVAVYEWTTNGGWRRLAAPVGGAWKRMMSALDSAADLEARKERMAAVADAIHTTPDSRTRSSIGAGATNSAGAVQARQLTLETASPAPLAGAARAACTVVNAAGFDGTVNSADGAGYIVGSTETVSAGPSQPVMQIQGSSVFRAAVRPQSEADDLVSMAEAVQEDFADVHPYETPDFNLLDVAPAVQSNMSREETTRISERLEKTLGEFNIQATVVQVTQGPTVTRFEIQPAPGVKVAKIAALESDIAMCMKAESVRIIAPVPGRGTVGLEIPNKKATPVFLREMLETDAFRNHPSPLAFALGMTISGEPYISDLATMPHVLIAGRTGSGKSVCLNSIICSILFRMSPDKVKFLMVDPKRVELNVYQAIPHLLAPVVSEPRKAAAALSWAVEQMDERYKKLASLGVRNIDGFNAIVQSKSPHPKAIGRQLEYMPHIVIVIDELADLMLIARNEVEENIIRLAQMSRAVGMHLILATQRPSVNVITGIIKANFPSRVAFQVASKVDSRTILDTNGAESLLGRGDMLFSAGGSPKPMRLQGCFVSDQEVERTADWVRSQARANYEKTEFLTPQEIEEQRTKQAQEMRYGGGSGLALDGIDADDSQAPEAEDDDEGYDYSYRQERSDGRPLPAEGGAGARGQSAAVSRHDDSDAIDEEIFHQAAHCILVHRKASVSLLQRKLKIGFARAGRVMDMLEERGIVGPNVGSKVREILVDPDEYLAEMDEEGDSSPRF